MSPILVRPVREQLEHDRIIRLLQTKFRRRFDVGINPGAEQNAPVGSGPAATFPDVVLTELDRGRKVLTVIEVETVESVNHLEALAEWVTFGRLKPSFHLYVPSSMMEVAKRLCTDHNVPVAEIHSYHQVGDELRFVPVYRAPADVRARAAAAAAAAHPPPAPEPRKGAKPATKPASRPSKGKTAARQPAKRKPAGRPEQRRGTKKAARTKRR
ncbi:MAG TPA: hypothetical protein VL243_11895 [Vicinamibacterales bacterium]|nr:hypothetical protein [Vicinamibacterales bacterium]